MTRADGYAFARLDWQICEECRTGLVIAVRVTDKYQRCGYAGQMLRYALRGREDYTWTTTVQKPKGKKFFRRMSRSTGVQFGDGSKAGPVPTCARSRACPKSSRCPPPTDLARETGLITTSCPHWTQRGQPARSPTATQQRRQRGPWAMRHSSAGVNPAKVPVWVTSVSVTRPRPLPSGTSISHPVVT